MGRVTRSKVYRAALDKSNLRIEGESEERTSEVTYATTGGGIADAVQDASGESDSLRSRV